MNTRENDKVHILKPHSQAEEIYINQLKWKAILFQS